MFYYLYEIKNNLNGKIYVGVHKTKSLDDGYMGSGKIIRSAIAKHGISNFSKVILEQFDNSAAMYAKEAEVVTDEFIAREDVYNLRRGGTGGFDYINQHALNKSTWFVPGSLTHTVASQKGGTQSYLQGTGLHSKAAKEKAISSCRERNSWDTSKCNIGAGLIKKKETFAAIGHQQGTKNSQFGKMWITNEVESRKITKTDYIPEGWRKGRVAT